jgi:hypothetical protein
MLLVWLSLCHGVDFIPTLKRLEEIRGVIAEWERDEKSQSADETEDVNEESEEELVEEESY